MNNKTKKIFLLSVTMMLGIMLSAQTQQGYVKTKGRMVDGKLVPGQGLKGATVSIKGRTAILVNADDGAFSFPVAETQFRLDSVNKKGYQLVDLDACPKTYKYSSNPLYIVMETPEQQLQDKLNAERKIRRNLQKQLQAKEDEIEALKEENKITVEEYQKSMQKLYEDQVSNEQLISDMAKRYSELDYDQLDVFYRQVSYFIENGELVKADSILRSRGDIKALVNTLIQHGQRLKEEKEMLQQAEAVHQADIEEASKRCYSFYETFYLQHQNDSAAHYLLLRAQLDSTNVEAQNDAAKFLVEFLSEYDKAIPYYQTAMRQAKLQYGEKCEWVATILYNTGMIHYYRSELPEALEDFNKSKDIYSELLGENHPEVATMLNAIGLVYNSLGEYQTALDYFLQCVEIRKAAFGENHFDLAASYNNIGHIYSVLQDFSKAMEYQKKSMEIKKKLLNENDPSIAITCANIGSIFYYQHDLDSAAYYFNKALEINIIALGEFHPNTATSYANAASMYNVNKDHDKALEYNMKALTIMQKILGENHPKTAFYCSNIGATYIYKGDYEEALKYLNKALSIKKEALGEEHPDLANYYYNIGEVQYRMGDNTSALESFNKAKSIWSNTYGAEDQRVISIQEIIDSIVETNEKEE
jgi:tetratricopeptide (TPR) repeat protein